MLEFDSKSVLLVMDIQSQMVARIQDTAVKEQFILNISQAIKGARSNNIPVIFVVVGFRQGAPEVSKNSSKSFAEGKERFASLDMAEWLKIHPDVLPQDGEVTVVKRRVSAFTGSDLEVLLRSYGARHLILSGYSTSGVVLSTVTEAVDKDFQLTVLCDACLDPDEELHRNLLRYYTKRGDVLSVADWVAKLQC